MKGKGGAKKAATSAAAASKKKGAGDEEDTGPPLRVNKSKEQRFKEEKKLKLLKWNFQAPTPEFLEQLRTQLEANVSKSLFDNMVHSDFKKHIVAIETLDKVCKNRNNLCCFVKTFCGKSFCVF